MFDGVFDERLQEQTGDHGVSRRWIDVESHREPVGEADELDVQVMPEHFQFPVEPDLLFTGVA